MVFITLGVFVEALVVELLGSSSLDFSRSVSATVTNTVLDAAALSLPISSAGFFIEPSALNFNMPPAGL
ncbi:hypothetical protein SDC9_110484 [bioreactor metagenome]|uniref:Uncharacterized protein n=1 Tax=bioreactor metagenome TaxID=1076179 RepID=A0A645BK53_9ZZZZ